MNGGWKWALLGMMLAGVAARGTDYTVGSVAELLALPGTLQAGDTVAIAAGTYTGVTKTFAGNGTAAEPIVVYASPLGGAKFEGPTYLRLNGSHITLAGLVFDGDGGPGSANGAVQFDKNSSDCRVTNCKFKDFNDGLTYCNWLFVYGYNHRIDHCSFEGKTSENVTVFVKPDDATESGPLVPRNHRFDHNYWGTRTVIGVNGFESIRIGDSTRQIFHMQVLVEDNLFYQAIKNLNADEMEVVSNKSYGNIYRHNTFRDNDGQLTLRHGDNCVVEGNFFFGSESGRDSGVRVIGRNHVVRNNYFSRVRGTGLRAALVVMKGDSDWPANDVSSGYEAADNAVIINNTFVACARPLNLGENKSDGVVPAGVRVVNNLVQNKALSGTVFTIQYSTSLIEFAGNLVYQVGGSYGVTGLPGVTYGLDPLLATDPLLGYMVPGAGSPAINAGVADALVIDDIRGLDRTDSQTDAGCFEAGLAGTPIGRPLERADVGPSYYGGPANSFVIGAYANWKLVHLGDPAAPDDGDDDGDGITTIMEYAWDLDPTVRDPVSVHPYLTESGGALQFAFRRNVAAAGVRIRVEGSTNLAGWDTVLFDSAVDTGPNNAGAWHVLDNITAAWAPAAPAHCVRVSAEQAP